MILKQFTLERRRAARAKRVISIQYRLVRSKSGGDTSWYLSNTQDMSVTGLSFLSEVAYKVDDVLELNVVMSGMLDIFQGFGKVVRVEKRSKNGFYVVGMKFVPRPRAPKPRAQSATSPRKRVSTAVRKTASRAKTPAKRSTRSAR